jgi:hypothetical protein
VDLESEEETDPLNVPSSQDAIKKASTAKSATISAEHRVTRTEIPEK